MGELQMRRLARAGGRTLDWVADVYGLARYRRHRRAWWKLWLGWRDESDAELRARVTTALLKRPFG